MDWKLFLSTFGVVFLAELGDKTQLATATLAAGNKRYLIVFVAAATALVAATFLSVLAGGVLGHFLDGPWVKRIAGAAFIITGGLLLAGKI